LWKATRKNGFKFFPQTICTFGLQRESKEWELHSLSIKNFRVLFVRNLAVVATMMNKAIGAGDNLDNRDFGRPDQGVPTLQYHKYPVMQRHILLHHIAIVCFNYLLQRQQILQYMDTVDSFPWLLQVLSWMRFLPCPIKIPLQTSTPTTNQIYMY
jgi:hypothetical protein